MNVCRSPKVAINLPTPDSDDEHVLPPALLRYVCVLMLLNEIIILPNGYCNIFLILMLCQSGGIHFYCCVSKK